MQSWRKLNLGEGKEGGSGGRCRRRKKENLEEREILLSM